TRAAVRGGSGRRCHRHALSAARQRRARRCQPNLARVLREIMLRELASAQFRTLMLGRMSAPERVATFLLDMFERRDAARTVDLPMSRNDVADNRAALAAIGEG